MERIFDSFGEPFKCSENKNPGHNVQPNSVSLMFNCRLQLVSKCSSCGVLCTKIRRRQNEFINNNEKSFSEYFYVEYDATDPVYNRNLYF